MSIHKPDLSKLKAQTASPTPTPTSPTAPKVAPAPPERKYHVFYSTLQSCNKVTPTGRRMSFVLGKYITDQKEEIECLQSEIAQGNMYLSVIPGQEVMTAEELDPMKALRKQHFEEFKKEQAEAARKLAAGEPLSQSESEVTKLSPGSTDDIASLAGSSDSVV